MVWLNGALPQMTSEVLRSFAGSEVQGLAELLKSVKLSKHLVDVEAFCEKIGADNVADLSDRPQWFRRTHAENLARTLKLPQLKRKKLVNAILKLSSTR